MQTHIGVKKIMFFKSKVNPEKITITATVEINITQDILKAYPYQVKRAIEVDMDKRLKGIGCAKVTEIEGMSHDKVIFQLLKATILMA